MSTQKETDIKKIKNLSSRCEETCSFEDFVMAYLEDNYTDFPPTRLQNLIIKISSEIMFGKMYDLEKANGIAWERALYLKRYLDGDMYTTTEEAIRCAPIQAHNAEEILKACQAVQQKRLNFEKF